MRPARPGGVNHDEPSTTAITSGAAITAMATPCPPPTATISRRVAPRARNRGASRRATRSVAADDRSEQGDDRDAADEEQDRQRSLFGVEPAVDACGDLVLVQHVELEPPLPGRGHDLCCRCFLPQQEGKAGGVATTELDQSIRQSRRAVHAGVVEALLGLHLARGQPYAHHLELRSVAREVLRLARARIGDDAIAEHQPPSSGQRLGHCHLVRSRRKAALQQQEAVDLGSEAAVRRAHQQHLAGTLGTGALRSDEGSCRQGPTALAAPRSSRARRPPPRRARGGDRRRPPAAHSRLRPRRTSAVTKASKPFVAATKRSYTLSTRRAAANDATTAPASSPVNAPSSSHASQCAAGVGTEPEGDGAPSNAASSGHEVS